MGDSDRIRKDEGLMVTVEHDGDALVVSASGDLDRFTAKTLERELRRAIASEATAVFLDLSEVRFIDSAALRILLLMAKHSLRNEAGLRILRGSAPLERAIEASGLQHSLPLVE
jgi:anti-sigma B factor antagonist